MWSDRYDGELADIFDFQDTIARQIAGTLAANITLVEGRRQLDHPRPDQTAFDLVLRARAIGHGASRTTNRQFRELITKAIELDPNYAAARALLADALYSLAILGWTEFPDRELSRGADEARKAIALASDEPDGYRALGRILLARAEYDQAQNALKRAIEINPSDANALAAWGAVQSFSGEIAGAIEFAPACAEARSHARTELRLRSGGRLLSRAPARGRPAHCRARARALSGFSHVQCSGRRGRRATRTQGAGRSLCRGAPPPPAVSRSGHGRLALQGPRPRRRTCGRD